MRQVLQNLATGETTLAEAPAPGVKPGHLLIRTSATLISAGTERMLVDFGKANWIDKARQQPDKVRQVLEKMRTDGVAATLEAVRSKLDQPLALGYCNAGVVVAVGAGVEGFAVGDRVASNGKHAEVVAVPKNLCAKIPDAVSDEAAAFTVIAAIGLQGIRLADPKLGECVVVVGLGLIGLLTVQMLRAQGCRVLGADFDPARLALAEQFGAETISAANEDALLARAAAFSRGAGVDAVIITASTTSNDPMRQAATMLRKRGRIVLVGVVGLELSRADFYEKELSFQVSCSYGPGRYDAAYEEGGQDYPIGFVRWTEQRNFEAVLDLLAAGTLDAAPLISHRFALEEAPAAFTLLASDEPSLGIVIDYPTADVPAPLARRVALGPAPLPAKATVAFLGAGNYAGRVLIPAFKSAGAKLKTVVSGGGVSAAHFGAKYGFAEAATESAAALQDPAIDTVVIATRHDAHAHQVLAALQAGKHVFCEKPLCLTHEELTTIAAEAQARPGQHLMVGFNRRFAPLVVKMQALLAGTPGPKAIVMTVNAGAIPANHWTQDRDIGGGRIIGEACHFIDLAQHLAGAAITGLTATGVAPGLANPGASAPCDTASISLSFADGSIATIHYFANGNKGFAKERVEVFTGGRILQLDNFRSLRGWGFRDFSALRTFRQDKGQTACAAAFVRSVRDGAPGPIPLADLLATSRAAIDAAEALRT